MKLFKTRNPFRIEAFRVGVSLKSHKCFKEGETVISDKDVCLGWECRRCGKKWELKRKDIFDKEAFEAFDRATGGAVVTHKERPA